MRTPKENKQKPRDRTLKSAAGTIPKAALKAAWIKTKEQSRTAARENDTTLTGGVGAGSSFLLAVLVGLGFCPFPSLMPHRSSRLFRRRTCKVCRFLLSGGGVIFPRGGAGLFFRFYPRRF